MEGVVVEAEVVSGNRLGRKIGFPTANMDISQRTDITNGVYRSVIEIDGITYPAMSNVGIRPSVGGKELLLETHIIDFVGDLYGRRLSVTLVEKLRDEKRFASIGDLKEQLSKDYYTIKDAR